MNIYDYLDYRNFIKAFCEERSKENPYFSYRYISDKAGIKSSGYLSMIINGERNLTDLVARKLIRIFKLNKTESAYFLSLIHFNQAKTVEEKGVFYREILTYKDNPVKTVSKDSYELYDKWYYSAVRELVEIYPVKDNYVQVAKIVNPPIKPAEVEKSIEVLQRLQLIYKGDDGYYRRADDVITSGKTPHTYQIQQFQLQMLELARGAYDRFEKEVRELSTVTMSIDQPTFMLIKERLSQCRMEILELARNVKCPTCVYQMNMQIHPLTKIKEKQDTCIT